MKQLFKPLIAFLLAVLARAVIRRYEPRIIMVTGSVGKTSTKDAVATVFEKRFFVRKSKKNLNSEFGVPLTILNADVPTMLWNPFAWLPAFKNALALLILPNHYPNLLVLEVGADRPGDLARILKIATPDAVVVTRLPEVPVHVEAYTSPEAVREEEFSPAYALAPAAPLIISADDSYAIEAAARTPAHVSTYGVAENADVQVRGVSFHEEDGRVLGMQSNITVAGEDVSLVVKEAVGVNQVLPSAAALAIARAFEIPVAEALQELEAYVPPPGRGRIFAGKNGSVIIDDSYNSSPVAVESALETLQAFPHAKRRIAVLGDMLELGRYSVTEHARVGALARRKADRVIAVGVRSRAFANAPGKGEIISAENAQAAADALSADLREGDVVLVKGSQSIRTEKVVKALLADPADASKLVRQDAWWQKR